MADNQLSRKTVMLQTHTSICALKWTRKRLFKSILARPAAANARQHKDFSDEVAIQ
jgi:hypothetical protein